MIIIIIIIIIMIIMMVIIIIITIALIIVIITMNFSNLFLLFHGNYQKRIYLFKFSECPYHVSIFYRNFIHWIIKIVKNICNHELFTLSYNFKFAVRTKVIFLIFSSLLPDIIYLQQKNSLW